MSDEGARLFAELMRFKPDGLTANGWAVNAGVSRTIWADLRRHGNPSRRTLERLLAAVGSSLAEFEALRVAHSVPSPVAGGLADPGQGWRAAPLAQLPLFETRLAGEDHGAGSRIDLISIDRSRVAGKVDRPAALAVDPDAYSVTVCEESMWPRFRPGRRLLVSPAAPVDIGDDVLVQLANQFALIKELASRSANKLELRQFNPDVTFAVEAVEIDAIHRVLGEAIMPP